LNLLSLKLYAPCSGRFLQLQSFTFYSFNEGACDRLKVVKDGVQRSLDAQVLFLVGLSRVVGGVSGEDGEHWGDDGPGRVELAHLGDAAEQLAEVLLAASFPRGAWVLGCRDDDSRRLELDARAFHLDSVRVAI